MIGMKLEVVKTSPWLCYASNSCRQIQWQLPYLTDSLTHSKTLCRLFLVISFMLISCQLTGHKYSLTNGWSWNFPRYIWSLFL